VVGAIGVHLLPATGEFTYDTIAYSGQRLGAAMQPINAYAAPGGSTTDYSQAIDQLQAEHPECTTVSLVCAWFGDNEDASACRIYPSTTYIGGSFEPTAGGADAWRCSGLTQASAGLIPIPTIGSSFVYGGTPSDQSIVRCIRDLKSRGFKVVFYPFILMTAAGFPWRGRITFSPDVSSAASAAVAAFLGSATPSMFTPDPVNLTVAYSGSPTDYTFRRMILHYAWLCTIAGGVNLFLIGSELRGLETIRGPAWTPAGATDGAGRAIWDYPFVAGLAQLAADVRGILDSRGLTKNLATLSNLVAYTADWSSWMGWQHPGANGQWPHLDALWASPDIDLVSFDNYLPLSDWTTGESGVDVLEWLNPAPSGAWPPSSQAMSGLGLSGPPTIHSLPYLKANIEGGQYFNWFYVDGNNDGPGLDPNGSDLVVSRPEGDRLAQSRNAYSADQQILANKQLRWWWNNPHQAVYADASGAWVRQGPQTEWAANSKPIAFVEYGFPACDKGTNQPNVFYDPKSVESFTPYWSIWNPIPGGGYAPQRDDTLAALALQAIYEYWLSGANNESVAGVAMLEPAFCCVWNWDARPFPTFPLRSDVWGDAGNWPTGDWQGGRGPSLPPVAPSPDPSPGSFATFPALATLGWSIHVRPRFATDLASHVSGRETRRPRFAQAFYDIELTYDLLRADAADLELQAIAGFFAEMGGKATPFWLAPPGLSNVSGQVLGVGDGTTTNFPLLLAIGGYLDPARGTSGVGAVYRNGVAVAPANWSVTSGYAPEIVFATPPASGVAISADYGALWLCRFSEDVADLENFMALLWAFRSVKLQTARP